MSDIVIGGNCTSAHALAVFTWRRRLIGAVDGHAKNLACFSHPAGISPEHRSTAS